MHCVHFTDYSEAWRKHCFALCRCSVHSHSTKHSRQESLGFFVCFLLFFVCFGFFFKLTTYKFLQKVKQNTWVVCASRTVKEGILASWNRPCPKHSSKVLEDPACANSEPSALLDGEKVLGALTRTGRMMGASPTPGEGFAFQ